MPNKIRNKADRIITAIQADAKPDKGALAALRTSKSITDPGATVVWPYILANLDEQDLSRTGTPTREEIAVYTAIRLYAIYQQGVEQLLYTPYYKRNDGDKTLTLFQAMAGIQNAGDDATALRRQITQVLATTNFETTINSLTRLVGVLKGKKTGAVVDFAQLAEDIFWYQTGYKSANKVRLQWGQDFYRSFDQLEKMTNQEENNNAK